MTRFKTRLIPTAALLAAFSAGCQSPLGVPTSVGAGPDQSTPVETQQLPAPAAAPEAPVGAPSEAIAGASPADLSPTKLELAAATPTLVASASSEITGYGAARAVDGNTNLEWKSGPGSNPTLILDRGASGLLTALPLKTNPNQVFAVAVSDDRVTWKTVLSNQKNTTWSVVRKALPAGTTGRYVRLAFTSSTTVMVFEATPEGSFASAPTPAPTAAPTVAPTVAPTTVPTAGPTTAPVTSYVQTRFGNQSVPRSADGTHTRGYALIGELGMSTIREGWNWANLQTAKGSYVSWLGAYTDPKTAKLASLGLKTQAMVCDTPTWATSDTAAPVKKYTVPAGLKLSIFADGSDVWKAGAKPNPSNYFAVYMFDMATRYKGQVSSWQVWNEPDFPSGDLGAGYKGANGNTRYWTGTVQEYVRLLKVAHTVVKNVDPAARISLGGLGYENYLAAILDNGGAPYFDIVDFHAYGTDKSSANGVLNSSWGFLGRYDAMKKVMTARGVTGKTYAVSETGMTANNPEEQAGYAAKLMATAQGLGDVEMAQWAVFTNPGHLNIGLIDKATLTNKTKGYAAYAFSTRQLAGVRPAGALTGTNVQGWRFERPDGKSVWLAWSKATSATATLPAISGRVLDKYGATRVASFAGGALALTSDPVWVQQN